MSAVRYGHLHLQEFFGNLGGIDLDALAEGVGIHLPALDLGKGGLPLPGHLDIGDALVLHYLIHGKPLVGRHEALLLPAHVVTGKEGLDDGGTGGGRADTVPFQAVPQLVVPQLPAAMLHRRKEAALGVQGTGLGLFLHALRRLQGERLAGLQGRQSGCTLVVLVPLVPHGTPSGRPDDRPLGGEHAVPRRERDGGNVLEATGGEGFEQAGGYHVVHRALVGGQFAGQTLGDDERMVVGNFPHIHAAAVERSSFQGGGMGGESRVPLQQGDAVGYLVEHIVREVTGAGTGVAQHLLLVKRLGDGEGLVRREAVPAVRLFLQGGQVVEQGRLLAHFPALHVGNLHRPRCGYSGEGGVCRRKGFVTQFRDGGEGRAVLFRRDLQQEIGLRGEIPVLQITGADHHQGGRLHPSEGVDALPGGDAESLGGVQPYLPVGDGTGFGGTVEVVVVAAGLEVIQPLPDGTVGQRGDPEAQAGLAAAKVIVDVPMNGFALTPGIGRHDDTVGTVENLLDDLQLFEHAGVGLVFLALPYLAGDVLELLRQNGQVLTPEARVAVCFGHGELDKMAERPGNEVAVT